ncbi:MAG: hypothetical protein AAF447_01005 [Myxococcota bacterium]
MADRIARLMDAHGPAAEEVDHGSSQGWRWRLAGRVYLLYARGQAQLEGARWATETMSRMANEEYRGHRRRIYIAWSFEEVHGYGAGVGMHFIEWFTANRQALNRFMVLTENSILRMTARTASLALPAAGLVFPRSAGDFDRELGAWLAYLRTHGRPAAGGLS